MGRKRTREPGVKFERQQIELSPSELKLFKSIVKESGERTKRGAFLYLMKLQEENRRLRRIIDNLVQFDEIRGVDSEGKETRVMICSL